MSVHFHRYPIDSTFGIEVLRKAGFAYITESFLFVQVMSSLKGLSLEISTQLIHEDLILWTPKRHSYFPLEIASGKDQLGLHDK